VKDNENQAPFLDCGGNRRDVAATEVIFYLLNQDQEELKLDLDVQLRGIAVAWKGEGNLFWPFGGMEEEEREGGKSGRIVIWGNAPGEVYVGGQGGHETLRGESRESRSLGQGRDL